MRMGMKMEMKTRIRLSLAIGSCRKINAYPYFLVGFSSLQKPPLKWRFLFVDNMWISLCYRRSV